jgi:hypothetical protein
MPLRSSIRRESIGTTAVKACAREAMNLEDVEAGSRLPGFQLRRWGDDVSEAK